jgi:hypothetical protein
MELEEGKNLSTSVLFATSLVKIANLNYPCCCSVGCRHSKYGDLAATIAAVLLDPEARSVNLDADPFKGNLREPLLRLMAFMRGMELQLAVGQPIVKLLDLDYKIGMMAHNFRSVFSFMLPEYVPGGRPREATLVAPEAMLMDMPKVGKLFFDSRY